MKTEDIIREIKRIVKTEENHQPRKYNTLGGMWTVDHYEYYGVTYQLMDEGYTNRIYVENIVDVCETCGNITFYKGDNEDLLDVLEKIRN